MKIGWEGGRRNLAAVPPSPRSSSSSPSLEQSTSALFFSEAGAE